MLVFEAQFSLSSCLIWDKMTLPHPWEDGRTSYIMSGSAILLVLHPTVLQMATGLRDESREGPQVQSKVPTPMGTIRCARCIIVAPPCASSFNLVYSAVLLVYSMDLFTRSLASNCVLWITFSENFNFQRDALLCIQKSWKYLRWKILDIFENMYRKDYMLSLSDNIQMIQKI